MSLIVEEEHVPVHGGTLWTASQGTGVPLVLCHGGPGLCDNLGPAADLLTAAARVHRYDQRGNGLSVRTGPPSVETLVADLDALREHWGYERWVVGGHSWGAVLALFYAVAHPARTLGVVSIAGTGMRWGWQAETRRHRLARLSPTEREELAALEDAVATGTPSASQQARFLRLMWSTDFVSRSHAETILDAAPLYRCPRNEAVFRSVAADQRRILESGFDEALHDLQVPLLAVHGDADAGLARSRELVDLVPRGRLVILRQAGHSPWLEVPAEFGGSIRAFLADL